MEEMLKRGVSLGGEQSGHVDLLRLSVHGRRPVHRAERAADHRADRAGRWPTWRRTSTNYPQVLLNVRVREKVDLQSVPAVAAAIARVETRVCRGGQGRLLVRYSGTEPLLRVMLEGRHEDEIRAWAQEIVDVVKEHLGRSSVIWSSGHRHMPRSMTR